jgi:hypothetical protein
MLSDVPSHRRLIVDAERSFFSGAGLAVAGFIEEARTRPPGKSHDA